MSNPYGNEGWPGQERPPSRIKGSGVAVGAFLVPVPVFALAVAVASAVGFLGTVVVLLLAAVGSLVVLVAATDPFRRGLAAGLLITLSVVLLLFGACFAILSQLHV